MAIRSKNLNLLPILQTLLREQSVARTAEMVGLSQPAVSGALARLRELMDDPLLVRVGRTMRLTPRALALRKQLDEVCSQIDFLFQPEAFEAASAEMNFRIAAPDYLAFLISRSLLVRMSEEAPGIKINFVDIPVDLPRWMDDATIDLAVGGDFGIWSELCSERLFHDRTVAAVGRDHPLAKQGRITSDELLRYPSVAVYFDSSCSPIPRLETGIPILDFPAQITTMSMFSALLLAAQTPVIARSQASLIAEMAEILPLIQLEIADENTEIDTRMFWAPATNEAPQYRWLRQMIRDCLQGEK